MTELSPIFALFFHFDMKNAQNLKNKLVKLIKNRFWNVITCSTYKFWTMMEIIWLLWTWKLRNRNIFFLLEGRYLRKTKALFWICKSIQDLLNKPTQWNETHSEDAHLFYTKWFWEQSRDIHIECSKQFKWNLYFYVFGQSRPFWAALKLL